MTIEEDDKLYLVPPFDNVFISSSDGAHNGTEIENHKITHILCTAKYIPQKFKDRITYLQIEMVDDVRENLKQYMRQCVDFIENARNKGGRVLIHCSAGVSRSASVCILYMMYKNDLDFDTAYKMLRQSRKQVCPNPGFVRQLITIREEKFAF
jgi:protein-tyrosine phosphatase